MKKNYLLLSGLALVSAGLFAQGIKTSTPEASMMPTVEKATKTKTNTNTNKAPGDTLYYDSFAGGPGANDMPVGTWGNQTITWTRSNPSNNGNDWIWSTTAPGGQYTGTGALNSSSASDGYMMLPADAYNTPTPAGGFVNMDAQLTSSAIAINPSPAVLISIETSNRYCCNQSAVDLIVEVSSDGNTWSTAFDAANGNPPNIAVTNTTTLTFNATSALAYQDTAYIRFNFTGGAQYYWMFDDLVISEGFGNTMELEDYSVNFSDNFVVNPVFTIVPQDMINPLTFDGATVNAGGNVQTGVYLDAQVYHDSTWTGGPGDWLIYQDSTIISNFVTPSDRDTVRVGPYFNIREGYFTSRISVLGDSVNQNPSESFSEYRFAVSDTVMAKDRNTFTGDIGVGSYINNSTQLPGGSQGDMWTTVITTGPDSVLATSLSFFVSNAPENFGVQISPIIYEFEGDSLVSSTIDAAHTNLVGENLIPTTINAADTLTWKTIDFASGFGTGNVWLEPNRQYAIGWRQENGGNGEAFFAGRAFNMEPFQPDLTNFINFEGNTWGWVTSQPAIRLNLGNLTTSVDEIATEENVSFAVSPNPTNGAFTLNAESSSAVSYNLNVRNMLGQVVYAEVINVNGQLTKNMNLSDLDKGVYFVSLENDQEKMVKKVILK